MSIRHKKIPFHHKKIVNVCFCGRLIVEINIFSNGEIEIMSEPNDGKKEIGIDGDALGVRDDFIIGRFSLSFDGMERSRSDTGFMRRRKGCRKTKRVRQMR